MILKVIRVRYVLEFDLGEKGNDFGKKLKNLVFSRCFIGTKGNDLEIRSKEDPVLFGEEMLRPVLGRK